MVGTKNLRVVNLPENATVAELKNNEQLSVELLKILEKYNPYEFLVRSMQLVLVYNIDCTKLFKGTSPIRVIADKVNFWYYDGSNHALRKEVARSHITFTASIQGPLKQYCVFKDGALKTLDVILLYDMDYEKWGIEKYIKDNKKTTTEEGAIFSPVVPKFNLDKVILNKNLKEEILNTLLILKKRKQIYEDWGFNEVEPAPKAILNFYGPPGTGKTMTAQAIAAHLDIKILMLNYADIESKYVGDAPKNLVKAFDAGLKENALLFFDEADSFLGKRIANVSSSSDQAVNSLRSQMLMLLENFTGIVVFATNLLGNYDKAFESRIFKHLHFDLPDAVNRREIIKVTIPAKVPLENNEPFNDAQLDELAKLSENFSGRHIKNAVLNSLIYAISENRDQVYFSDFSRAFIQTAQSIKAFGSEPDTPERKIHPDFKKALEEKVQAELANQAKLAN